MKFEEKKALACATITQTTPIFSGKICIACLRFNAGTLIKRNKLQNVQSWILMPQ